MLPSHGRPVSRASLFSNFRPRGTKPCISLSTRLSCRCSPNRSTLCRMAGFNLSRVVTPESLEDFVDRVVPILQERGAYKGDYRPGTLCEKLFGRSRLLP